MENEQDRPEEAPTTVDAWEQRYAHRPQVWSGRVNAALEEVARTLSPGTALDIGSGEGGDVIWLASRGWQATGLDASKTAVERALAAARTHGLSEGSARFVASDLTDIDEVVGSERFNLVTMSFMQSPASLTRRDILEVVAPLVAVGGLLLLTSHAEPPPWSSGRGPRVYPQPAEEEAAVRAVVPGVAWETLEAEIRTRVHSHAGREPAELRDTVVLMRRLTGRVLTQPKGESR